MAFTVEINEKEIFPVIYLKNERENTTAEIYGFGALLNSFFVNNAINIIDGFISPDDAIENIPKRFQSAKLSPFVCRTANNKYSFNGNEYTITKLNSTNEAIHGLLYNAMFLVIDSGANNDMAFVKLQYDYLKDDEGFPFNYRCVITYKLEINRRLSIETTIQNNSVASMPISDGWHPYFTLGCKIDALSFKINGDKVLEFNDKLIPTGNIIEYKKFQLPEIIGNTVLDNCFLLNENDNTACTLSNRYLRLTLTIKPDASYPYLQVYTPENRKSIAIENLSAIPNSFNNRIGLTVLNPGEHATFKTTFTASFEL